MFFPHNQRQKSLLLAFFKVNNTEHLSKPLYQLWRVEHDVKTLVKAAW
jgi:hypothetical protein